MDFCGTQDIFLPFTYAWLSDFCEMLEILHPWLAEKQVGGMGEIFQSKPNQALALLQLSSFEMLGRFFHWLPFSFTEKEDDDHQF